MVLQDGDEIVFGGGLDADLLDLPHPDYCNLKLAVARAMHTCGASEIIDEMFPDYDGDGVGVIESVPVYLGGPYVADDALFRRLHDRLYSSVGIVQ